MIFKEAIIAMMKGKKVRRSDWSIQFVKYIKKGYGCFNTDQGGSFSLSPEDVQATDWMLVEETSLQDKAVMMPERSDKKDLSGFYWDDIEQVLKEFFSRMKPDGSSISDNHKLARKLFGDRLIS